MLMTLGAALFLVGPAAQAASPRMPAEIAAYYRAYNFVNALSTPAERRVLARSPAAPSDRRLAAVARALEQLIQHTEEIDRGIVPEFQLPELDPQHRPAHHEAEFRSDIVRVISWSGDEVAGEGWVELEVSLLDENLQGLLLDSYDRLTQGGRSMPEADKLTTIMRRRGMRATERYHWRRIDGEWLRGPAALIFTSP